MTPEADRLLVAALLRDGSRFGLLTHEQLFEWSRQLVTKYGFPEDSQLIEWLVKLAVALSVWENGQTHE